MMSACLLWGAYQGAPGLMSCRSSTTCSVGEMSFVSPRPLLPHDQSPDYASFVGATRHHWLGTRKRWPDHFTFRQVHS
jgi:hypothetical protein